jgi:hypothetical protein
MNIKFILLIIITQKCLIHCEISSKLNLLNSNDFEMNVVAKALSDAIVMAKIQEISVIIDKSELASAYHDFEKVLMKFLNTRTTCVRIDNFAQNNRIARLLNVIVLKNYASFAQMILPDLSSEKFSTQGYFLLIFLDSSVLNVTRVFNEFWQIFAYNVNVILHRKNAGSYKCM